jgi:hypothetical protein
VQIGLGARETPAEPVVLNIMPPLPDDGKHVVDVLLPHRVYRGVNRVDGGRVGEGNRVDGGMTTEETGESGESEAEDCQLEFEARGVLSPQVILRPSGPQNPPEILRRRAGPEANSVCVALSQRYAASSVSVAPPR